VESGDHLIAQQYSVERVLGLLEVELCRDRKCLGVNGIEPCPNDLIASASVFTPAAEQSGIRLSSVWRPSWVALVGFCS
jgi:hypothetical protein